MAFVGGRHQANSTVFLEQLNRDVETRDVDGDVGAYAARSRRAYVNAVEGELITRDAQH